MHQWLESATAREGLSSVLAAVLVQGPIADDWLISAAFPATPTVHLTAAFV